MPAQVFRTLVLRHLCTVAAALAATLGGAPATGDGGEAALKAAFLYNFALYTEWPELGAVFEICVLGRDELGEALDALSAKAVAGRPIRVRRLGDTAVPEDCNLLFVAPPHSERLDGVLAPLAARPLLTIAEHAANATPMLRLSLEQGRLVFDVNQTAARAAGLSFSAKLLRLARSVQ